MQRLYDQGARHYQANEFPQAAECFKKAAEMGHIDGQIQLAFMHSNGKGIPQDFQQAIHWFEQAALRGNQLAKQSLAYIYSKNTGLKQNLSLAAQGMEISAQSGNQLAQQYLAFMYSQGEGVEKDLAKAAHWYAAAAKQGDAYAQYCLGVLYIKGWGVVQDAKKAVELFHAAASQGNSEAQNNLAHLYKNGEGVKQDAKKAAELFHAAAKQNHRGAQFNLGLMYEEGEGVVQDHKQAVALYQAAAAQKQVQAQNNLGLMYRKGLGIAKDEKQAQELFQQAAKAGNRVAQYNLGLMPNMTEEAKQAYKRMAKWEDDSPFIKVWTYSKRDEDPLEELQALLTESSTFQAQARDDFFNTEFPKRKEIFSQLNDKIRDVLRQKNLIQARYLQSEIEVFSSILRWTEMVLQSNYSKAMKQDVTLALNIFFSHYVRNKFNADHWKKLIDLMIKPLRTLIRDRNKTYTADMTSNVYTYLTTQFKNIPQIKSSAKAKKKAKEKFKKAKAKLKQVKSISPGEAKTEQLTLPEVKSVLSPSMQLKLAEQRILAIQDEIEQLLLATKAIQAAASDTNSMIFFHAYRDALEELFKRMVICLMDEPEKELTLKFQELQAAKETFHQSMNKELALGVERLSHWFDKDIRESKSQESTLQTLKENYLTQIREKVRLNQGIATPNLLAEIDSLMNECYFKRELAITGLVDHEDQANKIAKEMIDFLKPIIKKLFNEATMRNRVADHKNPSYQELLELEELDRILSTESNQRKPLHILAEVLVIAYQRRLQPCDKSLMKIYLHLYMTFPDQITTAFEDGRKYCLAVRAKTQSHFWQEPETVLAVTTHSLKLILAGGIDAKALSYLKKQLTDLVPPGVKSQAEAAELPNRVKFR